jgi:two-component system, OmpR family, response regulator
MNILVVDDDPDIRRIAALALERLGGFRVALAESGDQALAQVDTARPDVILLDVSMPGADGPEILAALRSNAATRNVPVIFFTATSSEEEAERLRGLGAIGVVPKPFELGELSGKIRTILEGSGRKPSEGDA